MSSSLLPQLRQLGLPASLVQGVVTLVKEHTVCQKGETLTSEQARYISQKSSLFHLFT